MKRLILSVAAALSLAACATPQPTFYGPAAGPQAVGFSEFRIEPGRYRVTFRGGAGAPEAQVSDYALLRAADLALADGYEWFRVYSRSFSVVGPDPSPRIGLGVGGASFGGNTGVGLGLGTSFPLNSRSGAPLSTTIEVVMGQGPKPATPDAYDAAAVRRTLGVRT